MAKKIDERVTPALVAQLVADPAQATCPVCGNAGFYDNRNSPKRGKGPYFKCKSKTCNAGSGFTFGVFQDAFDAHRAPSVGAMGPIAPKPPVSWPEIGNAYHECVSLALKEAQRFKTLGVPTLGADLAAMTATLFIARGNHNAWGSAGKAPPKPEPPAKRSSPPPEDFDDAPLPYEDEPTDGLPF